MNTSLTKEQLKQIRKQLGLSQEDMGRTLGVTREWIGMLERGDRPISASIILEIQNLQRGPKFPPDVYINSPNQVGEEAAPYGSPSIIRREIEDYQARLLSAAGDDTGRLGWIREQQLVHLRMPAHWQKESGPARSEEDEAAYLAEIQRHKATMPKIRLPGGSNESPNQLTADEAR